LAAFWPRQIECGAFAHHGRIDSIKTTGESHEALRISAIAQYLEGACSRRHIGLPLEFEFVDLTKPHTADYLALNPSGRTPTLRDSDFILTESTAIMHYLAEQKPNALWPTGTRVRADILRWQSWQLQHWHKDACEPLLIERRVKALLNLGPPDATIVKRALEAFNREARVLDMHLQKQPYLVGSEPTLADFSVVAPLFYAKEGGFPLTDYAHLRDWFGRVSALPAWRETAPAPAAAAA
jgi:glutathione S-transferase